MMRTAGVALVGLSIAACGGNVANAETGAASSGAAVECPVVDYCGLRCSGQATPLYPPSCNIPACSCVPVAPHDDWVGTYHRPDESNAVNLVLEGDGTFRWTIDGCDVTSGDCGQWRKSQPHTIVLLSSKPTFLWSERGGTSEVSKLDVVGEPNGDLVIMMPSPGAKPTAQRWKRGRVCAACERGNAASHETCNAPVPARCR